MPRSIFTLALLFGLVCVPAGFSDDDTSWPRFRGPNGTGVANHQDIPVKFSEGAGIVWKTPIAGLGYGSPVVWKDSVFLQTSSTTGDQRLLLCLDAGTGKEIWSRSQPGKKVPTHAKNSLASSTPATDGTGVFISFWDGRDVNLAGYSMKGDLLWTRNLGPWFSEWGPGTSPIVYKDKVFFVNDMDRLDKQQNAVTRRSVLLALNKQTGEVVWEVARQAHRACYSTPFILEKPGQASELVITSTTAITSYHPDNGTENWHWNWTFTAKAPLRTISSPLFAEGLLFAFSGDGGGDRHMCAIELDGAASKAAWQNKNDFPYVPCCLFQGPNIYFVNDHGFAGCFEARTGKKIWYQRLGGAIFSASPVLIDGKIYAASEQGDVFVIAAEPKYELLARNALGELIRATPAVADGRLFVRGQNHLFCISKKN